MAMDAADGNKGSVTFEELDVMIQLKTIRIGKDFRCTDCIYQTKMKCNLEKHIIPSRQECFPILEGNVKYKLEGTCIKCRKLFFF